MSWRGSWKAGLVSGAVFAVVASGCGGSHPLASGKPVHRAPTSTTTPSTTPPTHAVHVRLMSGQLLTANLPASPLGTSKSIASGVDLKVWEAQRSAGAVTVIFSLDEVGSSVGVSDETDLEEGLTTNEPGNTSFPDGTDNVSIFDPANLTDYETFCQVAGNGNLSNCLDSADDVFLNATGDSEYFAAVVAAPPASVQTATFVSGVGSVPDIPISG